MFDSNVRQKLNQYEISSDILKIFESIGGFSNIEMIPQHHFRLVIHILQTIFIATFSIVSFNDLIEYTVLSL